MSLPHLASPLPPCRGATHGRTAALLEGRKQTAETMDQVGHNTPLILLEHTLHTP